MSRMHVIGKVEGLYVRLARFLRPMGDNLLIEIDELMFLRPSTNVD